VNKIQCSVVLALLLLCNISNTLNSQNAVLQSLKTVLQNLENRFDVRFSYEDQTLEGIEISPLPENLSLEEALDALKHSTGLNYTVLSARFIAITPASPYDFTGHLQELDEIVVENYLTKGLSKKIDGSINFSGTSFTIFPGLIEPDVLQIVQKLPGIISVEERISDINIRGGTNDQNLVLYEGIRMYQTGHFFGLISAFNPYLTKEVNTSKNGTSAKYGDAVSGVISIEIDDKIDPQVSGGAGVNMLSVDAFSKIPFGEKVQLQLAARRSYTDVFSSATYNAYFDRIFRDSELNTLDNANTQLSVDDEFLFYDLDAKLIYDIDTSSKLSVNVLNLYNRLNYNQTFTTNTETDKKISQLNQYSLGIGANYSKYWKNDLNLTVQGYYSNYDLDANNTNSQTEQSLIQENEVNDYGLKIEVSKAFKTNFRLTSGLQFNEVGVTNFEEVTNPDFRSFIKEVLRTYSLYSELEWRSNSQNTFVRLGARGNYFEKLSKFVFEPRLSLNQNLFDGLRFEVLGEIKSQALTQIIDLQQDFFGIEKRRWQLSNGEDIPVITSQQASIGLSYTNRNWLISAEGFIKNVNDITARSQGFQNQFQFINDLGSYTITGVEFLVNNRFKNLSTWLSYTYSINNYSFNTLNNGLEFANTLDLRHVANASITYTFDQLKLGLGVNWHSGRPYTAPANVQDEGTVEIEYEAPNASRLPDYYRTDISAIYTFGISKRSTGEIGASIWNIFNTNNIINRFYRRGDNNSIIEINNQSLSFTPNFSFRLKF
jgi:hypothetical protein